MLLFALLLQVLVVIRGQVWRFGGGINDPYIISVLHLDDDVLRNSGDDLTLVCVIGGLSFGVKGVLLALGGRVVIHRSTVGIARGQLLDN